MDLDVIFWLVVGGLYLLRAITGGKKKQEKKPAVAKPRGPQPDVSHISSQQETARTPEEEFGLVIKELKSAFGIEPVAESSSPEAAARDPEVFGGSEEQFERQGTYQESRGIKEQRFENRPAFFVPAADREESFERRPPQKTESTFFDDKFEKMPASSEVSFKDRWKGHESDFEFHSPLEDHGEKDTPPAEPEKPIKKRASVVSQLEELNPLQQAVLFHEILGKPVSRRTRSVRHRPS